MDFIKKIANKIGIDKSIAYSSGANVLGALAGLGTVYFLSSYLSQSEQGYYFTFVSLVAIQTFFDLGLTGIMTQYVAHEQAYLQWSENETLLIGEEKYRSRLSYLLHFCVKWYAIISVLLLVTLIIVGFIFFTHYEERGSVTWETPWILICIGTSMNLFLAPITSFLSGLGKVKEVSKIFFYRQLIIPLITWLLLIFGFKLYVVGIASICTALYVIIYINATNFRSIIINIWKFKITERVNYMKEIFPYQWRIALSWISGYFIYQLFNPVLFATSGAIVAGQMGMTLQVLNAIGGFSMNWINTKVPLFSRQIEMKDFKSLDKVFNKTVLQESGVCLLLLIIFFICVYGLRILHIRFNGHLLGDRFLDYIPLLLMIIPIYANQFIYAFSTYLRCHKREPFLPYSIIMAILTTLSTLILGKTYGLYGLCIGYSFLTVFVGIPLAYYIYKTKKSEWHKI